MAEARAAGFLGSTRGAFWLAGLAAALVCAAYGNTLRNPFVFDDLREIVENTSIEHLASPLAVARANLTRPIVNLSYTVDYWVWGGRDEFGFHLTNVVLHILNVLLLFGLIRQFVRDLSHDEGSPAAAATLTAFVAASLFAVHPLMTEAVGYVSSRSELLVASFLLSSLLCFHRAFETRRKGWLIGGLAFFVMGLATKENAIVLPVVLLLYDRLLRRDPEAERRARFWRLHLPLLAFIAAAGAVRIWLFLGVEHPRAGQATWDSALTSIHAAARYMELLAMPVGQSLVAFIHPVRSVFDGRFVLAAVMLLVAGAVAVVTWRRQPLVAFGIGWFFLLILPSSSLTLLSELGQSMAEHRTYLPSCGFFMAAGVMLAKLAGLHSQSGPWRARATAIGFASVLVALLGLTIARNRVWADPVVLWQDAVTKAPGTWLAVQGLADAYRLGGECRSAMPVYQQAITLSPKNPAGYVGLALCSAELGQTQQAAAFLRLARSRLPDNADVRLRLARLEETWFRDPAEALRICQEALTIAPGSLEAQDCVRRNQERMSATKP